MFSRARFAAQRLLHHFSPPFCIKCRSFLDERLGLCDPCLSQLHSITSTHLSLTRTREIKVFALARYEDPIKSLILKKSHGDISAAVALGHLTARFIQNLNVDFDCVVPVPLHWRRYAWRGYNQAEEMARVIAQRSGRPLINAVKRVRYGPFQARVASDARDDNVRNAFVLSAGAKEALIGKRILLVDDLMTTGATLRAVSRSLLFLLGLGSGVRTGTCGRRGHAGTRNRSGELIAIVACRT